MRTALVIFICFSIIFLPHSLKRKIKQALPNLTVTVGLE